jgi:hypothetical protein
MGGLEEIMGVSSPCLEMKPPTSDKIRRRAQSYPSPATPSYTFAPFTMNEKTYAAFGLTHV